MRKEVNKISTIAELLVKIGCENSSLKKGLTESESAIKKAFSANPVTAFTDSLSGVTSGLSGVIGKMSGLVALSAGGFGLGAIVDSAVNAGESVYQLSTKFGITAGQASELNRILKLTGSDTQTFSTAMLRLDKAYTASGDAGDKCRAVLDATGVSLTDSSGKLLPLNQQLENLSKGYKLAADSGQQEEFIMNTLGARGMALVGTLKNLSEAKQDAAKVTGAGLDPQKMHDLKRELDVISLQSTQVGLALTGALAPVATELFPPIMSGLKSTAEFLVANKTGVIELTKDALELAAAYKGLQMLSGAGSAIAAFWAKAATDAAASAATQTVAADGLSVAQEKAIARSVAASNKGYMKMQADAVKAAQSMGLSAEKTANIITEKSVQIATESAEAAEAIRTKMIAAFLQSGAAATEFATVANTAIASTGVAAMEAATVKTTATTESAELCAAAVVESSAEQVTAIETVSAASALAAEKSVAASATMVEASAGAKLAQEELAVATALPGDAAIVAGEKTVGAMAVAESAVASLGRSVWALMGGWLGLIAIMGYAAYKSYQYGGVIHDNYVKAYNQEPDMSNHELDDSFHNQSGGSVPNDADSRHTQADYDMYGPSAPSIPQVDLSGIGGGGGSSGKSGGSGKSDAEKEMEKLQKAAAQASKSIEREWIQLTNTKLEQLDAWKADELKTLNESASANDNYNRDVTRLDEIYAEKKKKILYEQQKDTNSIWDKTLADATDYSNRLAKIGMGDGTKQVFEIKSNAAEELTKIKNAARDTEQAFEQLSNESKLQTIQAMTDAKTAFTVSKNGMVVDAKDLAAQVISGATNMSNTQISLAQDTANKTVIINKEMADKLKTIHREIADFEGNLTKARNDGNLSAYVSELSSERAALSQDLSGRQEMIDIYYETWKETHRSSMSYMSGLWSGTKGSIKTFFSDIFTGTKSLSDAWSSLGSSIGKVIADMVAEWVAAQITMAIFGKTGLASSTATSAAGGAATAAAWAPAAAMVSLATFGANAGPAMGAIGLTTGFATALSAIGLATGGLLTGPGTGTSDSILLWGSNREYMLNAAATQSIGVDNLDYMNKTGKLPGYATGGLVTGPSLSSLSGRYASVSSASVKSASGSATTEQKNETHNHLNLQLLDYKGFDRWLENGGGEKIQKFFGRQSSAFAGV